MVYDGKGGEQVCHYLEMTPKTIGESYWLPQGVGVYMALYYDLPVFSRRC